MSVSDPLLKSLKASVLELSVDNKPVGDQNPYLEPLCSDIERIFLKGFRCHGHWFKSSSFEFWTWILAMSENCKVYRSNAIVSQVISSVKECQKVQTKTGKGRLFIRNSLVKKCLTVTIEILRESQLTDMWYDPLSSILANEILREIFLSLLTQIQRIDFQLNLNNASFLDETWILPVYRHYEFVPCKDLGIHYRYVNNRAIVTNVDKNSVAGEDGKVTVGDVLDDLYGECLKGAKRSKINNLSKENQGWPVYLGVVKCRYRNGKLFPPLNEILSKALLKPSDLFRCSSFDRLTDDQTPIHALLPSDDNKMDKVPIHTADNQIVYDCKYLGRVYLGVDGRVNRIEDCIAHILRNNSHTVIPTMLLLNETEVICTDTFRDEEICRHSYTEISSCGRRTDCLLNFAYIAGETTCSLAKNFYCYIFEALTEKESKTILCTIAQGFGRTQWYL